MSILHFVQNNILLILTISGMVISFLASFIGLISKKKPILILATLAVLGFSVAIAYQISAYYQEQEKERQTVAKNQETERRKVAEKQIKEAARLARNNVIDEINLTVKETKNTLDSLVEKLDKTTMQEAATELVSIRADPTFGFEETIAFAKGSREMWPRFADWLTSLDQNTIAPSLSLAFSSDHHYESGLLLAYLLTGEGTSDKLRDIVFHPGKWNNFPAEEFYLKAFTPNSTYLDWILFYDETAQVPVAYANAQLFTRELMIYHRLEQHDMINNLLNSGKPNTLIELQKLFPSIQTVIFDIEKPAELVKLMIDQQLAVAVTTKGNKTYVAKLVPMIQLAEKID